MRVHHLNCATMCPFSRRLFTGQGPWLGTARMVCHCLLIETSDGLVLVDSGFGLQDLERGGRQLGGAFVRGFRPTLDREETAARQVERLGFSRDDVRHMIVTHLDLDHCGGLPDFPRARVHVSAPEYHAAMARRTPRERERYIPAHWAHEVDWAVHPLQGESWMGFERVRAIAGVGPEVLLVPLHGHTRGHVGVAVRTTAGWMLHAGDAYFFRGEMDTARPHCPPALALFQRAVAMDDAARRTNQARLRALRKAHGDQVAVFSAHDPVEFDQDFSRYAAAAARPLDSGEGERTR